MNRKERKEKMPSYTLQKNDPFHRSLPHLIKLINFLLGNL